MKTSAPFLIAALTLILAGCGGAAIEVSAAATPESITLGDSLTFAGTATPAGEAFAFAWQIEKAPAGSTAALEKPAEASTPFTPDRAGTYEVRFTVMDPLLRTGGGLASLPDTRAPASTLVTVTVAPRPPAKIVFRVQPTDIVAGASFAPVVQVDILDSTDGVAEGATANVSLTLVRPDGSTAQLLGAAAHAALAGLAPFAGLSVDRAGFEYSLTATVDGLPPVESDTFAVRAAPLDLAHSTFTALPPSAEVDSTVALALNLRDAFGNGVAEAQVAFEVTGSLNLLAPTTGATDATGLLSGSLTSTRAEQKTITATFPGGSLEAVATFTPGAPDPLHSSIVIAPDTLKADGVTAAVVTVTVRDTWDNPISGAAVDVSATGAGHVFDLPAGVTGSDGVFTSSITSTFAETKKVSATFGDGSLGASVTFTPGLADAEHTTIVAVPSTLVADGAATSLVTIRVADLNDNPIANAEPLVTVSGVAYTLAAVAGSVTDAFGVVAYTVASTKAEAKTVRAELDAIGKQAVVVFTPGAIALSASTLTAAPTPLAADNTALATVTATVRDAHGNPIAGVVVTFDATGTGTTLSATTGTTDASGVALDAGGLPITLRSSVAGAKGLTAKFATPQLTLATSVVFVAGPAAVANSSLVAYPISLVANGTATTLLTATLKDATGNAAGIVPVSFAVSGSGNDLAASGPSATSVDTDTSGVATITLASTKAEVKTVTLSFGAGLSITTTVTFVAGPAIASSSSFTASPASLVADGATTTTLTATLLDVNANPVNNSTVTFTSTGTVNTFSATTAATNESGVASVTLSSTMAEAKTVTATFGNAQTRTADVTFLPGAAAKLAFGQQPTNVVSTTAMAPAVTLRILDAQNNQVTGSTATVTLGLGTTPTGGTLTGGSLPTNAAGVATFAALTVDKAQSGYTLVATSPSLTSATSSPFNVSAGAPSALSSTFNASPSPLTANNSALATLTATVRDAGGNPIAGVVVTFDATGTGTTLSATTGTTDASGVALDAGGLAITIRSSVAGTKGLTAKFATPQLTLATSVVFAAGLAAVANSSLVAYPISLVANGTTTTLLTATLEDATGNSVGVVPVSFAVSGSGNDLAANGPSAAGVDTDTSGVATITLASTKAEVKTVTLSFGAGLSITTTVTFVPGAAAKLAFGQQPTNVASTTAMAPAVTVRVLDAQNNLVTNSAAAVALGLGATPTGGTLTGGSLPTNTGGVATFAALTVDKAQNGYTLVATSPSLGSATSSPFNVTAGAPSALSSTLDASPTTLLADGQEATTLTATVRDAGNNAVPNATIAFTSNGTGNTFSPPEATASTNASGVCSVTLRSTRAEVKTVTATLAPTVTVSTTVRFLPNATVGSSGSLALGTYHACALVNGAVKCWGDNYYGVLGNNSAATSSLVPTQVSGLTSGAQFVAANENESCAVVNGGVQCWGLNDLGQLGNNSTIDSPVPVAVSGLTSGAQAVAVGRDFACALVNGGVRCWGSNAQGQLGNGTTTNSLVPVQVSGLTAGVQSLAGSLGSHMCAVANGGLKCWGSNNVGQLGDDTTVNRSVPVQVSGLTSGVQSVAAGIGHTCAVVNGGLSCWGYNLSGQLGNSSPLDSRVPVQVSGLTSGATAVSTGHFYSCAIVNGSARCWGDNSEGQLGDNTKINSSAPVNVSGVTSGAQAIGTGGKHACAMVNGGIQCWGAGARLGTGSIAQSLVPVQVLGISTGRESVVAGDFHTCALVSGGVQCWGANSSGQLGNNSTTTSLVPVPVTGLTSGVQAIAAGSSHTCALVNGGVRCWGLNGSGQLGNNSTTKSLVPVAATGLTSGVQAIAAGVGQTCALVNGGVQCWGNNTVTNSLVPAAVPGLTSGAEAISAGNSHVCALVSGGVQCWGNNYFGQLGNNSTSQSATPVAATGLTSGVQAITVGGYHSCALKDGSVQCWGHNDNGQLGDSTVTDRKVPTPTGLTGEVQAIASGYDHACALVNGGVRCWGVNNYGQVGNNSTTKSLVPVAVSGLTSGVQSIGPSGTHTCAQVGNAVRCWGANNSGQLGNNSTTQSLVPVAVVESWP